MDTPPVSSQHLSFTHTSITSNDSFRTTNLTVIQGRHCRQCLYRLSFALAARRRLTSVYRLTSEYTFVHPSKHIYFVFPPYSTYTAPLFLVGEKASRSAHSRMIPCIRDRPFLVPGNACGAAVFAVARFLSHRRGTTVWEGE